MPVKGCRADFCFLKMARTPASNRSSNVGRWWRTGKGVWAGGGGGRALLLIMGAGRWLELDGRVQGTRLNCARPAMMTRWLGHRCASGRPLPPPGTAPPPSPQHAPSELGGVGWGLRGAPFNLLLGSPRDSFTNAPLTPPETLPSRPQNLYLLIPGAPLCKCVCVCMCRGVGWGGS